MAAFKEARWRLDLTRKSSKAFQTARYPQHQETEQLSTPVLASFREKHTAAVCAPALNSPPECRGGALASACTPPQGADPTGEVTPTFSQASLHSTGL